MELVVVLIAVAVLGLGALAAAGRFGEMQSAPVRDTYQPPVPEGKLQAEDLEGVRFGVTPLGYDMAQVDDLMARMARELAVRDDEQRPDVTTEQFSGEDAAALSAWAPKIQERDRLVEGCDDDGPALAHPRADRPDSR